VIPNAHPDRYGKQSRSWAGADGKTNDQIAGLVSEIKQNPLSQCRVVSAWNPLEIEGEKRLSRQLRPRSADLFFGAPFFPS
jgi:thymidylate synthase